MDRLNPNRSKLCCLTELYSPYPLPPVRTVEYMQTHRGCGIYFVSGYTQVKAFLSLFMGRFVLQIESEEEEYDQIFYPPVEILALLGLLESRDWEVRGAHRAGK